MLPNHSFLKVLRACMLVLGTVAPSFAESTFPPLPRLYFNEPDFAPQIATGSSPLNLTSSDTSVATIVAGKIHVKRAGACMITASSGNSVSSRPLYTSGGPGYGVVGWKTSYSSGTWFVPQPEDSIQGKFATVAGGDRHQVGLTNSGRLRFWGSDPGGTAFPDSLQGHVVAVSAGQYFGLALTDSGRVVPWGTNAFHQIDVPDSIQGKVVAIAAGWYHGIAVTREGRVCQWGDTSLFQGRPHDSIQGKVLSVSAGEFHNTALLQDGRIVAWGQNIGGVLFAVPEAGQGKFVEVVASQEHSLARTSDGRVFAWGNNAWGELRIPDSLQGRITSISAGPYGSFLTTTQGLGYAIGNNSNIDYSIADSLQGHLRGCLSGGVYTMVLVERVAQSLRLYEGPRSGVVKGKGQFIFGVPSRQKLQASSSDTSILTTDPVSVSGTSQSFWFNTKKDGSATLRVFLTGNGFWAPTDTSFHFNVEHPTSSTSSSLSKPRRMSPQGYQANGSRISGNDELRFQITSFER